ncbi:MAG: phage tail tape measure protein [Oscillospiraceae bacterium]|nr:phage tail tape measure protein [Oscillospiraceae bacterium]
MAEDRIEIDIVGDTSQFDSAIEKLSSEVSEQSGKLSDALKSVNTTIAETHDKLADVADQLNMNPGNTELLAQKQALLTQAVSATSEKLEMLKHATEQAQNKLEQGEISQAQIDALQQEIAATTQSLSNYQTQLGKTGSASDKLQSELDTQKSKLNELKKQYIDAVLQYGKNSDEAQNLAGEIKSLSSEYNENQAKMQDAVDAAEELTEENDDLSDSTEDVADNENELSKENTGLLNSMEKVEKSTGQAETGATNFGNSIEKTKNKVSAATIAMGNVLADLGKKAISSLGGLVDSAMETGKAFENSMSNVTALQKAAGATEEEIASLKKVAEDYGASTQFTMAECADALGYMALASWNAEQSASALPGVLSLSAASGMNLASASDMVTDYMSAFSKSVSDYTGEALTAAEFSDKLAYAQANSNTNVQQLGEAYKNCAANMNAAGQQMDTVTAILGTLANQGLKGSKSGTALSAVMRDINNSMENGAISIAGTTVAIADANGNYRDLIDIMADVEAIAGQPHEKIREIC